MRTACKLKMPAIQRRNTTSPKGWRPLGTCRRHSRYWRHLAADHLVRLRPPARQNQDSDCCLHMAPSTGVTKVHTTTLLQPHLLRAKSPNITCIACATAFSASWEPLLGGFPCCRDRETFAIPQHEKNFSGWHCEDSKDWSPQKSSTKNRHELTLAAQGLAMAAEMDEWLAGIDVFQVAPESTYVTFAACCRLAPCRSSSCGTELPSEKSSLMDKRSEKSLRRDAEYHIASLQPTNDITTLLARKDAGWPLHRFQMSLSHETLATCTWLCPANSIQERMTHKRRSTSHFTLEEVRYFSDMAASRLTTWVFLTYRK